MVDVLVEGRKDKEVLLICRGKCSPNTLAKHVEGIVHEIRATWKKVKGRNISFEQEYCLLEPSCGYKQAYDTINELVSLDKLIPLFKKDKNKRSSFISDTMDRFTLLHFLEIDPYTHIDGTVIRKSTEEWVTGDILSIPIVQNILNDEKRDPKKISYLELFDLLDKYSIFKRSSLTSDQQM